jgi:hypothetical protein
VQILPGLPERTGKAFPIIAAKHGLRPASLIRSFTGAQRPADSRQFAFGYDIKLLENENADFQRHLERQPPGFNRWANASFPYWHFVKLPYIEAVALETLRAGLTAVPPARKTATPSRLSAPVSAFAPDAVWRCWKSRWRPR